MLAETKTVHAQRFLTTFMNRRRALRAPRTCFNHRLRSALGDRVGQFLAQHGDALLADEVNSLLVAHRNLRYGTR